MARKKDNNLWVDVEYFELKCQRHCLQITGVNHVQGSVQTFHEVGQSSLADITKGWMLDEDLPKF